MRRAAAKFLFDKPPPRLLFARMAQSGKKFSPLNLAVDAVLTLAVFTLFYEILQSHVPSRDPMMIHLWAAIAASCLTAVFWLAWQMVKTVYRFQRDSRK